MGAIRTGRSRGRPGQLRSAAWRLPVSLLDVKLGVRMLAKHPLMTAVAMLSLAVGIPVGFAPAHLFDALEAPLPVEDGDRVMGLRFRSVETLRDAPASSFDLAAWREALTTFEDLGAVRVAQYNLDPGTGMGAPVSGAEVTASTFPVLWAAPLLGRTLQAEDDLPGAPAVVVLGHDLWQSRLGGDPRVVGRPIRIGDAVHTVIGVMPKEFLFPVRQQMWLPLRERPADEPGRGPALRVFGRLKDDATPAEAQAELEVVRQRLSSAFPDAYAQVRAEVVPFTIALQGLPQGGNRAQSGMWFAWTLALALLVVACVNVGLLIFARTTIRSSELAVRSALGAARARIVGQIFVEALVLAVLSTMVGLLLLEFAGTRLLAMTWSPASGGLPWWVDLGVTPETVGKAMLLAVFSAAVASIVPALWITGSRIQDSLRRAGATGSGVRIGPVASALIVVDMAMAVAAVGLVVGASQKLADIAEPTLVFPAERFLSAEITLSGAVLPSPGNAQDSAAWAARVTATQRGLLERLRAEPAVQSVAVASVLPRMDHPMGLAEVAGGVPGDRFGAYEVEEVRVIPGFFEALGQRVLAGRDFNITDLEGDRRAVIVSRKFVEKTLGGRNPVGRQIRFVSPYGGEPGPWFEIVGVVPDLDTNILEPQNGLGVYHPAAAGEIYPIRLAIGVGSDPGAFIPRLRELAEAVDPAATVLRAEPLNEVLPDAWNSISALRLAWSVFVGILLVLAATGVYTMMSFSISQRTREIGIRSALGAQPTQIVAAVGRRAAVQIGVGALVGMPLAGWVFYQVQPYTTTGGMVVLVAIIPGIATMLLVGLLACTAPLLRALRIVPTEAMRADA